MTLPLHDIKRRRDAKRANERIKLLSTFMNNLGVAIMGGAVIVPLVTTSASHYLWIMAWLALHMTAQANLANLLSEDCTMDGWCLTYGVPAGALLLGIAGLFYGRIISMSFKRKYPLEEAEYAHRAPGE